MMKRLIITLSLLIAPFATLLAGCPTVPPAVVPTDASDGSAADAITPWNRPPDASIVFDPGVVVDPTCAKAAQMLHASRCPEADDATKFGVLCTMSRGGSFDFREACLALAGSPDAVRGCCAPHEPCSRVKCVVAGAGK